MSTERLDLAEDWIPNGLSWEGEKPVVRMSKLQSRRPLAPFLFQDINADVPAREIPLSSIPLDSGATPAGFIFHMSRCGSTLVSQMLAQLDEVVMLSEPQVLNDVLLAPPRISA